MKINNKINENKINENKIKIKKRPKYLRSQKKNV